MKPGVLIVASALLAPLAALPALAQEAGQARTTRVLAVEELERQFASPPPSARPWVYWFWLDGNITKAGITADLEAMQRVGLGGALWMWGGGVGEGVKGPVRFMSPQWFELMRHTVRKADRLGLKINLTAGSGWSHSGGPWIKPEHSMRRLEMSQEIRLTGPVLKEVTVPEGDPLVAVLAYPLNAEMDSMRKAGVKLLPSSSAPDFPVTNALDQDPATRWISEGQKAGDGPTEARPQWLVFEFPSPFPAAALYLEPFHDCGPRQCQWQVSTDGKEYETVCQFELAPDTPRTIPFEASASRFFRLLITSAYPFQGHPSWNVQIAEIQLLQSGEQPLKKVPLDSRLVVDLSGRLDASGHLSWDVPPGAWTVQVFRHLSTGDQPHPILSDEGGLECDKLSPEAVQAHWDGYIRRVLDECGPAARRVIQWVHVDSYEFGPQTWTPKLREEFRRRCGYDPLPYLPAVLGKVVDDEATTTRFLWDFRRVRADLFAEGIGGHLRELCRSENMALTTEPHLVPGVFDQIQYGGNVSEPVGNFLGERRTGWYAPNPPLGPEVHLAKGEASAAYTYGLDGVVWAEAFTGTDHAHAWKETPEYLKTWGDLWLTEGINRFAFHCWAHSPSLTQKPGITLGPWGIHFDRRNTWFDLATGYLSYLSRCEFLLQQGLPVMDVCVLTGDGVVAEFPRHPELRAAGYDYHGLTADVLKQATVEDGQIVLPSGMRYRLLVSYERQLRPKTIRKLRDIVKPGAVVLGVKPEDAPGLTAYPASRAQVRAVAEELWGSDEEIGRAGHACGQGRVFWGLPEQPVQGTSGCGVAAYLKCTRELAVLRAVRVEPDFEYPMSDKEDCDHMLAYAHRRLPGMEWYFISNQAGQSRQEDCIFRLKGLQPELWDPLTGEMRTLPGFREQEGRTLVPLEFAPGQSYFVVFRRPIAEQTGPESIHNFPALKTINTLTGPWEVSFDPQWGGPAEPVRFDVLSDWTTRPESGIKYYSGKAAYRKEFELPATGPDQRIFLHLGKVKDLAEVRLNGRSLGVVWCEPWRIEITGAARAGSNNLEVVVVNEWVNRLIGDSGQPQAKRLTWTTWNPYKPDSPLLASGLLGPVTLQSTVPDAPEKELPMPGEVFFVAGRTAFVIPGKDSPPGQVKPWVWYAPTLPGLPGPEERWMFEKFHDDGIAMAGIDAGESFGSPSGCALYSALYAEMTERRGYAPKPVLLGRSRGGLMTLAWATANPDKVAGFAGIYPVCNLASYPGVARAAPAYGMGPDALQARLAEYNPVDRLAPLAHAGVPLFAIHGGHDEIVPLEANSALLKSRYAALGGRMELVIPPGQGHNMWPGFFQCEDLVNFVKAHARP
jgi:hypothetical protein